MAASLHLDIVTPERVVYSSDDITMLVVRAIDGETGILPNHSPLVTALDIAPLRIKKGETETQIAVCGGFLDVSNNQVTVLAACAELASEIDVLRAEEAKVRAERRLQQQTAEIDVRRAEAALRRALVRLKVSGQIK